MFNLLSSKIQAFALDISDFSLKIVQLGSSSKRLTHFAYGQTEIPEGLVEQGEVKKEAELATAIKKAISRLQKGKILTKYVAVSLPEEKSFVDILRLPALKKEEISQAVLFEAANYIPTPLDEVYLDFEIINSNVRGVVGGSGRQAGSNSVCEVLIAATPKKIVDAYIRTLKQAGLKPFLMEVESLSSVRALVKKGVMHRPLLIIDFGQSHTSFAIFAGTSLRFTSTIPVSSKDLSALLMNQLKIDAQKAEAIKQTEGLWGDRKVLDAIIPALTDLTEQIKKHLDYYHSHCPAGQASQKVEKILLCGGGANLKGLAGFLGDSLGLRVELGNPWVNIFPPSSKEVLPITLEQSMAYATALGLALGTYSL